MDEDAREEQESRSILLGVLEAVLKNRQKRYQDILNSTQDIQKAFSTIRAEGRQLNKALTEWLENNNSNLIHNDLQLELSMYGDPSGWPLDARVQLQQRLPQILEQFHFNHSAKHIATVLRNSGL